MRFRSIEGFGSLLCAFLVTTGCITPQKTTTKKPAPRKAAERPLVMREKAGGKAAGDQAQAASAPEMTTATQPPATQPAPAALPPPPPAAPIERRQTQFLQSHLAEETKAVTDDDERAILPQPPDTAARGSIAEASLAVAVMKRVVATASGVKTGAFVEQDTSGGKPKSSLMIETLSQQRGFDFLQAVESNPFLLNPAAQRLALKALDQSSDSQPYRDRGFAAMRRVSDQWTSHQVALSKAMGTASTVAATPAQTAPGSMDAPPAGAQASLTGPGAAGTGGQAVAGGGPLPDAPSTGKPVEVKPVEAGREDAALTEAQSLADAGKYQEAIARAQGIPASSPAHAKAQERIKNFANRAVQELRMKAAQAFQGSLPISDPKARTAYLERARKFLEEAIKTYPQADQLGTVKENLAVITRDIERMKDEPKR